jgi:hypothetical protein
MRRLRESLIEGALPVVIAADGSSTVIGASGVLIVHEPVETDKDPYVFESDLGIRVEDVVANYTPTLPSGESATIIDYPPYEDFGTFSLTEPLRQEEDGRLYESEWSRMDIASWNNLGVWRDKHQARGLARHDLRPYLEDP